MTDWLYHLPVIWMTVVVFCGISLIAGVIYGAVLALATGSDPRGERITHR